MSARIGHDVGEESLRGGGGSVRRGGEVDREVAFRVEGEGSLQFFQGIGEDDRIEGEIVDGGDNASGRPFVFRRGGFFELDVEGRSSFERVVVEEGEKFIELFGVVFEELLSATERVGEDGVGDGDVVELDARGGFLSQDALKSRFNGGLSADGGRASQLDLVVFYKVVRVDVGRGVIEDRGGEGRAREGTLEFPSA